MKIFKLPDLGEGLPDATIREWHVKTGDTVTIDQPLVSMETAKALVEVPSPVSGKVEKLFGNVNDVIETGQALIGFVTAGHAEIAHTLSPEEDSGTVVGKITSSNETLIEATSCSQPSTQTHVFQSGVRASPAIRALARRLNVDLTSISPQGERITRQEVQKAAAAAGGKQTPSNNHAQSNLSPQQRAMVLSMTKAHEQIVPVTLVDDADIHVWYGQSDTTVRLIRAIAAACAKEPTLNAHFDAKTLNLTMHPTVNLGLAIDTVHGLYVPVIRDIAALSDKQLRAKINTLKEQAQSKSIPQSDLHDATIMLSNYGAICGKYANPIITPPTVAIIGTGRVYDNVVSANIDKPSHLALHKTLPLSLTVDHRVITGGQAARFLKALIQKLASV